MKSIASLTIGVTAIVIPGLLLADLGPIVVTGTKTEVPLAKSPVPVTVITSEQIRASVASDAADLLQLFANVDVASNGSYGKTTSVFIRGAESNHTVVLINGVKINPATIGLAALQNISPDLIERIEIVKGPRSSLYGSEAIGGVVNIITRKAVDGRRLNLVAGAGEDDTRKAGAGFEYGNDYLSGGIRLESFDTDGFPVNDASEEDHGFDKDSVNAFLDFNLGKSDLRLSHWQADGNVEYFVPSAGDFDQDFENRVDSVVWEFAFNARLSSNLRLSSITDDIRQNQPNFLAEFDFATTERDELEWQLNYLTSNDYLLSLGLFDSEEDVEALSFGTQIDESNDVDAVYLVLQRQYENHSYSLALRESDYTEFGDQTTWNIDYRYWISNATSVYAGAGTAFRAPDFSDRFGFGGNPSLDPEESETVELGLEHSLDESTAVSITLFENDIDDLIGFDPFFMAENIDRAEITGIEIAYRSRLGDWDYNLSILAQDPQDKTTGEKLLKRAERRLNLNVARRSERWKTGGSLTHVGPRDDFGDIELDAYELVNVFVSYRINPSIDLSAKIENLFDEEYETAAGFNTKGRTAFVQLDLELVD